MVALNHDFVGRGNGEIRFASELLPDRFHDVVRQERLAVIFPNVTVRHKAGFAAQITGELAAVVVLDDDRVLRSVEAGR